MRTIIRYKQNKGDDMNNLNETEFIDYVDTLTDAQRVKLRKELETQGNKRYLLRSLYYNYETQNWID